jgi:hypothetical protein
MEDGGGTAFLFREEWAERTGEESRDGAVAARASRRSRPCHTRPCNEIAMVARVGPIGTGIVADAGFDQLRLWLPERTATPVGASGRMSISLPDCLEANEGASSDRVLAGCADGSAIGEESVVQGTRLFPRQADGWAIAASGLNECRCRRTGPNPRPNWLRAKGDNVG